MKPPPPTVEGYTLIICGGTHLTPKDRRKMVPAALTRLPRPARLLHRHDLRDDQDATAWAFAQWVPVEAMSAAPPDRLMSTARPALLVIFPAGRDDTAQLRAAADRAGLPVWQPYD